MVGEVFEFLQLLARPKWPPERMAQYRRQKLRQLIHHAYETVPYYRNLMDGHGVRPEDIQDFRDLVKIPITTKADLRRAGSDALATGSGDLVTRHTSGHSGMPFAVQCTAEEMQTRRLREFRMLLTAARVRPFDRLVLLGPTVTRPRRLHRTLGLFRMEVIPCTLAPTELTNRFLETRPDVLWVYPTSLKTVLYQTGKVLSEICRPRTLITSAQVMEEPFREKLLADSPQMEIVDIYGASEVGRIASACEVRQGLHLEDDSLHVELLAGDSPVPAGEYGEAVITSLDQLAMPFIRYNLGDLCRFRPDPCTCGRPSRCIAPPLGRNADMISSKDGRKSSAAPLDHVLRDEVNLVQYRFVQTSVSAIRAELFYTSEPGQERLDMVRKQLAAALDHEFEITVQTIPHYRTDGQKFKVFVSEL
jgi:phenylacetate-CoA ligase